jgi:putative transcriptional regulator
MSIPGPGKLGNYPISTERGLDNLSQAELAEKLGVFRQTIKAIETERYDPSLPLAFKIALLFQRRIEDVFLPEEENIATSYMDRDRRP